MGFWQDGVVDGIQVALWSEARGHERLADDMLNDSRMMKEKTVP